MLKVKKNMSHHIFLLMISDLDLLILVKKNINKTAPGCPWQCGRTSWSCFSWCWSSPWCLGYFRWACSVLDTPTREGGGTQSRCSPATRAGSSWLPASWTYFPTSGNFNKRNRTAIFFFIFCLKSTFLLRLVISSIYTYRYILFTFISEKP